MDDLCTAGGSGLPAVAGFVGMWAMMMIPMMLPSLAPSLRGCGSMAGAAAAGSGYFLVWTAAGLAAYPLHDILMHSSLVAGITVVAAGVVQLTAWKARRLAACQVAHRPTTASSAWRHGVRHGVDCVARCANLMVALVAIGVMDLALMILATAAITAERYAPRAAKPIGAMVLSIGAVMVARTL
jgi:predicted metal-binding membrane protein